MTKARYVRSFSLSGQDDIDFQTAQAKFKTIEIVRMGIKEALKHCPRPPKAVIQKAKDIVKGERR